MNYDVLTYAVGLDLANMFLSGRSLKAVLKKGAHTLVTLGDDLRPLARVFLTSTLQAVENMMNRTADLSVLWREQIRLPFVLYSTVLTSTSFFRSRRIFLHGGRGRI